MKLFGKNKSVISIDFGSSEIKVVEGQATKTSIDITKSESLKLPKGIYNDGKILNEYQLNDLLQDFLKFNNFNMNLNAYGVINSSSIITREINLPRVEVDEIVSLIQFQIEEFLPINPEDYVIDFLTLNGDTSTEEDKMKILLIAIPVGIVITHLNLMKDLGLEPRVLDFEGNTISKLLSFNDKINSDRDTRDNIIVSIDLGYTKTEVTISINGNIEVTRAIDFGAKKICEDIAESLGISEDDAKIRLENFKIQSSLEDDLDKEGLISNIFTSSLDNIMDRVNKVIKYYDSREFAQRINHIVLKGGLSNIKGIGVPFTDYFNIPTIVLDELDKVKLNGELWRYANAIGALIRTDEVKK